MKFSGKNDQVTKNVYIGDHGKIVKNQNGIEG